MPQKKAQASPVYEMPHERQVELLSEALLREYMHRRKFTETLHVFDEEHPRDNDTISSRALMSDLMALGTETQRAMKADGVETIMEMLCALRVRRRMELEELKQRASVEAPPTPEKLKKSSKEKKGTSTKSSLDGSLRDKRLRRRDTARHKKYTGSIATDDSSNNNNNNNNSNSATSSEGEMESERRPAGSPKSELGSRLGKKLTRSIMRLLCGKKSLPASFLEQGFVFVEDVEYGLVQWERGPDGVIAVVQAFICAYFFRGGFVDVQRHQQQCLLRALTTILSSAQPDPRRVRLVNGPVGVNSVEADMVRLSVKYDFFSMPEVEESLHSLLEHWMQPRGSGVLCFLLSVLLSRGVDAAATILDGATTSLIDEEGRCSSNLARLLLRGEEDAAAAASDDVLSGLALG
ncbi:hypothetical protein DQ04_02101200, partial [Trypanosoma grayi]|uniref:hypothetical protein n=1 Tax=Trypanosoma grayi TaxID=71804 RepID=UPI0004F4764D